MNYRVMGRLLALLIGVVLAVPAGAGAQGIPTGDPGGSVRSRADLESLIQFYDQILASPAYSESAKAATRAKADRIRERLSEGDFRLGDRIVLFVQGEPELPDTLAVQAGPMVSLPLFGDVPLDGVLRSEVTEHIRDALSQFIIDPVVRAEGLMRVSVLGAVGRPGFYVVPADMLLSEAIMVAGGPSPTADIDGLRIERGSETVLEGEELQEADRQGLSLDQLNLQAGDRVVVPQASTSSGFFSNVGLIVGVLSSVTLIIFQVTR